MNETSSTFSLAKLFNGRLSYLIYLLPFLTCVKIHRTSGAPALSFTVIYSDDLLLSGSMRTQAEAWHFIVRDEAETTERGDASRFIKEDSFASKRRKTSQFFALKVGKRDRKPRVE